MRLKQPDKPSLLTRPLQVLSNFTMSAQFNHLRHPFWYVTCLSGAITLLPFINLLILYRQTEHWQYLAMGGSVGCILLAHSIAWWLGYAHRRFAMGIYLIAISQMLCSIITPLFASTQWTVGFFILFLVPIEVGIVDRVRRIPLLVVFGLLAAASMLIIDLVNVPFRLNTLLHAQDSTLINGIITFIHLSLLIVFLWYFRLRPHASHHTRIDLVTQQSLVFTTISAIAIILITSVMILPIATSQIEEVGQTYQTISQITVERVRNTLEQQIEDLYDLSRRESMLLKGMKDANASYPLNNEKAQQLLQEREMLWQTSPESSDFILQYRSNPQTTILSEFHGKNLLHTNLLLTDRRGGLIAAQGERPAWFFHGEEEWWQTAWNQGLGGVYVGNLMFDSDAGVATILIAIGIIDAQTNQLIGVLASTYELRVIQGAIQDTKNQIEGDMFLFNSRGIVIASTNAETTGRTAWPRLFQSDGIFSDEDKFPQQPNWMLELDRNEKLAVIAYSPLSSEQTGTLDPLTHLKWSIVVSDQQTNVLDTVTQSVKIAALVGVVVMALVVIVANALARVITRPIEALTTTAATISAGDLEQQVKLGGPVELVTLAEAFNTLTSRLRVLINNLQEQVAQRTEQLQSRVAELQELNARLQRDLLLAREIQQGLLLPPETTWQRLEIVCYTQPARDVGGDFYSYYGLDDERFAVAVGDVSGKGVAAALLMAASLSLLNMLISKGLRPGEMLDELDQLLIPYTRSHRQNCAMCYMEIDAQQVCVVNAGAIPPYIRHANGGVEFAEIGGLSLGQNIGIHLPYQEVCMRLQPGDLIILTSDGVVEAHNEENEMFSFERLEETLAAGPTTSAQAMLNHVRNAVLTFAGTMEPHDDVTIVVVQV